MKTLRGLECNTEVLETTGFFLGGNTEFNCGRKSRPENEEKNTAYAHVPNLEYLRKALYTIG